MTLLQLFQRKQTTPADVVAKLLVEIGDAENALSVEESKLAERSLSNYLDGEGAELSTIQANIEAAKDRIEALNLALKQARAAKEEEDRYAKEATWSQKFANYKSILEARAKAADKLRVAAQNYYEAWKSLTTLSRQAAFLEPNGQPAEFGSLLFENGLWTAVADEMARLAGPDASIYDGFRIPGTNRPGGQMYDHRELKPLIEQIMDANSFALRRAKEQRK